MNGSQNMPMPMSGDASNNLSNLQQQQQQQQQQQHQHQQHQLPPPPPPMLQSKTALDMQPSELNSSKTQSVVPTNDATTLDNLPPTMTTSNNNLPGPPPLPPVQQQLPQQPQQQDAILDASASELNAPPTSNFQPTVTLVGGSVANQFNAPIFEIAHLPNDAATLPVQQQQQQQQQQEQQPQQPTTPQKAVITKVKLSDELNLFDWFRTKEIINQIAEKAKNSVESMVTTLDPGMKEYLYSGGNINVMVISDSETFISPIRDAFQTVFGRATVMAAKHDPTTSIPKHSIKLACGFKGAIAVAQERIKNLRADTNNVPQNQVIVIVQPCIVTDINTSVAGSSVTNGLKLDENVLPQWFFTYGMIIEDPVLGATMSCFSQFIPMDLDIVTKAKEVTENYNDNQLGFGISINDLMNSKLGLAAINPDNNESEWIKKWSGLSELQIINDLSHSLAHLYRRKWSECVG